MNDPAEDSFHEADARALCDRLPHPLREVLGACLEWVSARQLSVAVHGSLIKGGADRYSDIDLTLAMRADPSGTDLVDDFEHFIAALGDVLTQFRADHIGRSHTVIAYLLVDGWVVKVDATLLTWGGYTTLPPEARIVTDPDGALAMARYESPQAPDLETLFAKLCGWLWFSYSRLARGELFSAARSLDFSREHGLLPILLHRLGLPQDGHRRIEERLPVEMLEALRSSHSRALESEAIFRALSALHAMVADALQAADFQGKEAAGASLEAMWKAIRDARAAEGLSRRPEQGNRTSPSA